MATGRKYLRGGLEFDAEFVPEAVFVAEFDDQTKSLATELQGTEIQPYRGGALIFSADHKSESFKSFGRASEVYPVYTIDAPEEEYLVSSNKFFVRSANSEAGLDISALRDAGLHPVASMGPDLALCEVNGQNDEDPLEYGMQLQDRKELQTVEPDLFLSHDRTAPQPVGKANLWHLGGSGPAGMNAIEAWQTTRGDPQIVVAVMDDGFDLTNQDLADHVVSPSNFEVSAASLPANGVAVPTNDEPSANHKRGDYHGMPCAGLAAGSGQAAVTGVAPACSWMPVRFPISFAPESMILGIFRHVSKHADIVSCSWAQKPSAHRRPSTAMESVVKELAANGGKHGKGLIFVMASGNTGLPLNLSAEANDKGLEYYAKDGRLLGRFFIGRPIYSGWNSINDRGVLVVGATSEKGRKALYGNFGEGLSCVAPSDNWHPSSISTRADFNDATIDSTDNHNFGLSLKDVGLSDTDHGMWSSGMGGSSAAAPQVAGALGLVLSANPQLTGRQAAELLLGTCVPDGLTSQTDAEVWNLRYSEPAFDAGTGRSGWFGHGLVNVGSAVQSALQAMS